MNNSNTLTFKRNRFVRDDRQRFDCHSGRPRRSGYGPNHSQPQTIRKQYRSPDGHELPLASMIKNQSLIKMLVRVDPDKPAEEVIAQVVGFDKWSITVHADGDQYPTTYFKHSVICFTGCDSENADYDAEMAGAQ